ncbi:hypothetical protein A3F65_00280 [Candidatus Saccharibacteria bacterium RIFCSPHIGHO2_12_FULL_47_16b]|nr:MAG: hypothetical protein A3F65_00280 [Candidatus Saccharibacteria bacterium RIFCSPHIGHO2_12_FULL_47_16b]
MDGLNNYNPVNETVARKKSWPVLKIIISLLFVLAIFAAGVSIGRGDKINLKGLSAPKSTPTALDYSSVDQVYNLLKSNFDGSLDTSKLLDGLKFGLVQAANDPYTEYLNAADAKELDNQLSGTFTGIGAELGTDENNNIVVVAPLAGYPAEKAGLQPKDIIGAIDGQSTAELTVSAAVRKIRGPADSQVKLTIIRGNDKPFDVTITRTQITLPSVESKVDGSIGYIKISQFTAETVSIAAKTATNFKQQGVKAVVLDLRNNPGGYLSGAIDVSSLWLEKGKVVVSERRGSQVLSTDYASGNATLLGLPTAIVINGGSASASEIIAGALHDNSVATIVGEKSFGKGSVQQIERLLGGAALKVTIARWFTPKGANIDKQGITPDIQVTQTDDDKKAGRDPQKDKAYEILRSKIQ